MKIHHAIAIAATVLGGAALLPSVPNAEAATPMGAAKVTNNSGKAVTCTVHRDDNGQQVASFTTKAKSKRWHKFTQPGDEPLMYLMCPGGPQGKPTKMRTKLDGEKADTEGWFVDCLGTGTCVANIRPIQKA